MLHTHAPKYRFSRSVNDPISVGIVPLHSCKTTQKVRRRGYTHPSNSSTPVASSCGRTAGGVVFTSFLPIRERARFWGMKEPVSRKLLTKINACGFRQVANFRRNGSQYRKGAKTKAEAGNVSETNESFGNEIVPRQADSFRHEVVGRRDAGAIDGRGRRRRR